MSTLEKLNDGGIAAQADVVFIHGLGGDPLGTWALDESESWTTWLPRDLPRMNLWTLGYEASPSKFLGQSMPLLDRATNALALLDANGLGNRPVAIIAHSLGGLVAKQMLRLAYEVMDEYYDLGKAVRLVVFFGTPHSGSSLGTMASFLSFFLRTGEAAKELRSQAAPLRELNSWYRNRFSDLDQTCAVFAEGQKTKGVWVVDKGSADPGIAGVNPVFLDHDHFGICKPRSSTDLAYARTVRVLRKRFSETEAADPANSKILRALLLEPSNPATFERLRLEAEGEARKRPGDIEAKLVLEKVRRAERFEFNRRLLQRLPAASSPASTFSPSSSSSRLPGCLALSVLIILLLILGFCRSPKTEPVESTGSTSSSAFPTEELSPPAHNIR